MSSEHHNKKPMTPLREMTLRWNAFVDAIHDEDIALAGELSKADPDFLKKPPKHLQRGKSTTVEIYNVEPFPVAFAWLWDQVAGQHPSLDDPLVQNLFRRAASLDTEANLAHLTQHFESMGMDPLAALHQISDGGGRLLHIALQNGKLTTADWMLTRRPDLLDLHDANGHTPSVFLQSRLKAVDSSNMFGISDSDEDLQASKNFLEIWSRKRAALDALDEMSPGIKRVSP